MVAFDYVVDGQRHIENIHVIAISNKIYIVDNSPFYVYGVSWCDKISVQKRDGRLFFEKVIERGGHSTYRVKLSLQAEHASFMQVWDNFSECGCSYEGSSNNDRLLYAIDVPPSADTKSVYAMLEFHEQAGLWEFEEAHYYDDRH